MSIEATKNAQMVVEEKLTELKNSLFNQNPSIDTVSYDKFKKD